MKIRSGFVSNSSSSSFILKKYTTTTAEVAYEMLNFYMHLYDFDGPDADRYCATKNALKYLLKHIDSNCGYIIPWTCNYETYIWRDKENNICVDTCNNHDWEQVFEYEYLGDGFDDDFDHDKTNSTRVWIDLSEIDEGKQIHKSFKEADRKYHEWKYENY